MTRTPTVRATDDSPARRRWTGAFENIRAAHAARWRTLVFIAISFELFSAMGVEIRWAESSNRIYVTGPGAATLGQIKAAQDRVPLDQVAAAVWYLRANLIIEDGAQLILHGTAIGGDVDELRLQSNNSTNTNSFIFINADWGSISIRNTSVSSWDDAAGGPDTEHAVYGRAFLGVRSKLAPDGVTPLESRMDIIDSDLGYLGHNDSEAYGLAWKVIGAHPDPARSIYDYVNVSGDILNSRLHHNFFGVYTFGHYGGHWAGNEVDHNVGYGFDPHDDSDYLVIENNNVHDNGWDGIIASMRCDHLTVRSNISRANGQNGIILHRNSNDCVVENNQCLDNGTTGIVLTGGWRCIVRSNLLLGNFEAGLRLDLGSADNLMEGNICASNVLYGFHLYKGSEAPEPNDDGRPKRNRFANNLVQNNKLDGIHLADSDDNTFETNAFFANGDTLRFERGFRNRLNGNDIPGGVIVKTFGSPFDAPVTYICNQPAVRVQLDAYSSTVFEDAAGRIFDPEEKGVATSVTTDGSTLTLTAAEIGTTSTVIARSLWGRATQGTVLIEPTGWTNVSGSTRQWRTQAGSRVQSLTYTVGDLQPNRVYTVRKAGLALMTLNSGSTEMITFADVAGTTNEVVYSVEPAMQVFLERFADSFVLSWMGGRLQRATSLSPPNWQDLPMTNGQFRTNIRATELMEFFRALQP